jgi:hypothetical protein
MRRRGGGYTDLAIVAEVHPIAHPWKTRRRFVGVRPAARVRATVRISPHTTQHVML